MLANGWSERGHQVNVVTQSIGEPLNHSRFSVHRRPNLSQLLRLIRQSDVVFQNNISLRTGWPLIFLNKPVVITYQTWLTPKKLRGIEGFLNRCLVRKSANIAISDAVSNHLPFPCTVIHNPFDPQAFSPSSTPPSRDFVFLGRLVSDKGAALLIQALAGLKARGHRFQSTIIGDGEERGILENMIRDADLTNDIKMAGVLKGEELKEGLRNHRTLVVPSRWQEPFGIVALEGIACGCSVVASNGGGLPEAVGDCGLIFQRNDVKGLEEALLRSAEFTISESVRSGHLDRFSLSSRLDAYESVFKTLMR